MAFQDMPPPGGFSTINIERTAPRPFIRQGIYGAILLGLTINGIYVLREWKRKHRILKLEQIESYLAVHPFFVAEQERHFLRHLRTVREEERELMKDHPGWKVGTLYGEPIFKTLPKGALPPVRPVEYTGFRPRLEFTTHVVVPDFHQ